MANPYLETDLQTASPEVLVGRLLDGAVLRVRLGIEALAERPVESTRSVARAVDIVSELRGAVDLEAGGEIARNLDALYEFVSQRLVLGSSASDAGVLEEGLRVLETLAEAWAGLLAQRSGHGG